MANTLNAMNDIASYDEQKIKSLISTSKTFWGQRNTKFKSWFGILTLIDTLAAKKLESYISNEPQTFYNMAHYLLTKGEISHDIPVASEAAIELDRQAKIHRGCQYMWKKIDRVRLSAGSQPFVDELGFFLLVCGWYSVACQFNTTTGDLEAQVWNPFDTYPLYYSNQMASCVHSYQITNNEALLKAELNGWDYSGTGAVTGLVTLDDVFIFDKDNVPYNIILIGGKPVTELVERKEMKLLVAPVAGFPDKGSLYGKATWQSLSGRSIFEVNASVGNAFNKWKSMVSQILRDTAQPVTQEFSATPQATPEQLRERGALFHYAPGEKGLERLSPPVIPMEVQANLMEIRREMQKGGFSDAVYGMVEQQPGYAIGIMATSSANQILYPYMNGKHFVVAECDSFWLNNLRDSHKVFDVKGRFVEQITSDEIPTDVTVNVQSDVATPKDWMERATIANMLDKHFDKATILTEVLGQHDPQAISRRMTLDRILDHPMSQMIEMIAGYNVHADYLESRGDAQQAALFRKAAQTLESQMGVPSPGSANPAQASQAGAAQAAGAPSEKVGIRPEIMPPETRGFTPQQLRRSIGKGKVQVK